MELYRRRSRVLLYAALLGACSSSHGDGDAGSSDPLKQAIATATLGALSSAIPSGATEPVSGTAVFAATASGVDLTLVMRGCAGIPEKPIRILEARSCDQVSATSPVWGADRGTGIPGVLCSSGSSGEGTVRYSRRAQLPLHWTIGDGSSSDVIGHAIAVFDAQTQQPTACGVIARGEDRTLVAMPADGAPPSSAARAQLVGSCLARLMSGAAGGACVDDAAIAACATEHCELGACLERCASYTACLDAAPDACGAAFTCAPSTECAECQAQLGPCGFGFCGEHLTCPARSRPDGPCSQLLSCCTLQGEAAANCLEVTRGITSLGGEASCVSGLADWDVVSHMHVPCNTSAGWSASAMQDLGSADEPLQGDACMSQVDCPDDARCIGAARIAQLSAPGRCHPRAPTPQLGNDVAGSACTSDAQCGTGTCNTLTALLTPYPDGYCSARCYEDATCGAGGVCLLPLAASDPGHCMQACTTDADCPREHYRCMPFGDGARVFSACYPREDALPDGVVGQPCQRNADCASGAASCMQGFTLSNLPPEQVVPAPGGYCSAACLFDEDCGAGAQCISGGVAGGFCMVACSEAAPCREGYRCIAHLRDADDAATVCLPAWD